MSKERKRLLYIVIPFYLIGIISLIVLGITEAFNEHQNDWIGYKIYLSIILTSIIIALITTIVMLPKVKRSEKIAYEKEVSLDFDNVEPLKSSDYYKIFYYNEMISFKNDGIYFKQLKRNLKYNEVSFKIIHKSFYGKKENYIQLIVDKNKEKYFPKFIYLEYDKKIMSYLISKDLKISNLDVLKSDYIEPKWNTSDKKVFHYSFKFLLIKIVISVLCFIIATYSVIKLDQIAITYLFCIPIIFVWIRTDKTGKLIFTKEGIISVKSFVKVKIKYDEIINVSGNEKLLIISSAFQYIQFENRKDIIEELKKHIKL